jgi:L-malate glycosyltransferase
MTRARLLHVFSSFDPGGLEVRTANLINAADEFHHSIVAMDGRYGAVRRIKNGASVEVLPRPPVVPDEIGRLVAPLRAPATVWRLLRNAWWIRDVICRVRPDLLLTYNLGASSALMAARALGYGRVIHAETGFNFDEISGPKYSRILLRKLAARNVAAIVVPSRTMEQVVRSVFRLPVRVIRIPNGVDVRRLTPADGSGMRRHLGLSSSDFVVGTVGQLRPEKGHLRLMAAFRMADVPNKKLLIVGNGPMRLTLETASEDMGISRDVVFAGGVDDVAPWYAAMDVFALASDSEQMPMALLEAMACGLPAVCTDVGDCRDVLGRQPVQAVVPVGEVAGFASALGAFGRDEAARLQAAASNRLTCIERFDGEVMHDRYLSLYRAIIGWDATRPRATAR